MRIDKQWDWNWIAYLSWLRLINYKSLNIPFNINIKGIKYNINQ